ncbi:hypothetical protein [Flavitalea sp.]|nr:hypothetical protein [Flavitalea sp.]
MKKTGVLFLLAAVIFASCKKEKDDKDGIFKGPEMQVHYGKAWTWVQLDHNGNPQKMAIAINDAAMNSLPTTGGDNGHNHGNNGVNNWVLNFHPKANISPFNYLGLDWNPVGHEPDPIYGKSHFDFHFYMMTPAEVDAIPAYEADSIKFKNSPAPAYLPVNYFNAGGGVPKMGAHWVDPTSPEFIGQPFTQTFIYGSYNGKVNFYEPMITLDFIKNNNNFERVIPQPMKVQKSGYYPTKLKIVKHDGVTDIILDGMVYRTES